MAAKSKPQDLFTQFWPIVATLNASNSSTLVEKATKTNLSIRGTFIWLIHAIEWVATFNEPTAIIQRGALSKHADLTAIPDLTDPGCLAEFSMVGGIATEGAVMNAFPILQRFLPPFPFAAGNISLYVKTQADSANWRGKSLRARIHYTTIPVEADLYIELAETWAFT